MLTVLATTVAVGVAAGVASSQTTHATRAPVPCTDAISYARTAFKVVGKFAGTVKPLPTMVYQAARAGANNDSAAIRSIAHRLQRINDQIQVESQQLQLYGTLFRASASNCK